MRRTLFAFSLTACLATAAPSGLFDRLWGLLSAIWEAPPSANQPQIKEGCGFDPSGQCKTSTPPQTKAGCGADPSGQCKTSTPPQTDAGCGFDPDGQCHPGS